MSTLFNSISTSDPLDFKSSKGFDYKSVSHFLDFDKNDLSKIAGVSEATVRLDKKIPRQLALRLDQIANICSLVAEFFDGDPQRTQLWFHTANPMLGYVRPRDMIRLGRYERLLRYVQEARAENAPHVEETSTS